MGALDTVADRQAGWSVTANRLKASIDRARWAVFIFSVLGAVLATLASQLDLPGGQTSGISATGAVANVVGIQSDSVSGKLKLSDQAARSIG